jgi:hypothetical protein
MNWIEKAIRRWTYLLWFTRAFCAYSIVVLAWWVTHGRLWLGLAQLIPFTVNFVNGRFCRYQRQKLRLLLIAAKRSGIE